MGLMWWARVDHYRSQLKFIKIRIQKSHQIELT